MLAAAFWGLEYSKHGEEMPFMEIKILGPGCAKCHQVETLVKETLAETGNRCGCRTCHGF